MKSKVKENKTIVMVYQTKETWSQKLFDRYHKAI